MTIPLVNLYICTVVRELSLNNLILFLRTLKAANILEARWRGGELRDRKDGWWEW